MCFWRPVGVRAGEVGAPLEFTSGSSWAGKGRRGTAATNAQFSTGVDSQQILKIDVRLLDLLASR